MEMSEIYFSVKLVSAIYILYKVWMLIFSPKIHRFWNNLHRYMRISHFRSCGFRKKPMAGEAIYNIRREKTGEHVFRQEDKTVENSQNIDIELFSNPHGDNNEVIGKTRIVYIEDPEIARKIPTRFESLEKESIEEDKDINPDDVKDDFIPYNGLSESEKQELMSNNEALFDPDFSRALTFEDLNNVADVLIYGTDDRKKIRNAATILYQLQDTDLFRFFSTELSTRNQMEKLFAKDMNATNEEANGEEKSEQSLNRNNIDWNRYM